MDYQKSINGLRGFAFLQVLLEHLLIPIFLIPTGVFGVNIFFVLSSFLLTSILYKQIKKNGKINFANYLSKRLLRIYPCFTIALIFEILVGRHSFQESLEVFLLVSKKGIYWTIFAEMRSYILIPVYVILFCKFLTSLNSRIIFIAVFSFVSLIWHIAISFIDGFKMNLRNIPFADNSFYANLVFVNFLPIFSFGSFAAIIYEDYISGNQKALEYFNNRNFASGLFSYLILFSHLILIIAVGVLRFAFDIKLDEVISTENLSIYFSFVYAILLLLIYANKSNSIKYILESKILMFLGDISFPGYLFNLSVVKFYGDYFQMKNTEFKTIFISLITLFFVCYLMHKTIETYFIGISKSLFLDPKEITNKEAFRIENNNDMNNNDFSQNIVISQGFKYNSIEKGEKANIDDKCISDDFNRNMSTINNSYL